jgi:predicted ATPase/DNA-binding CsgD family transcriptional regulator
VATSGLEQADTSFVGRASEIERLERLLRERRLITLTGAGGIGKSRLALTVAGRTADAYADGVVLVELAAVSDPALVPWRLASALGIVESADELRRQLIEALSGRHSLLVFDNCEHLVAACRDLAEVVTGGCPKVVVLCTSRMPLHAQGETVWQLSALGLPRSEAEAAECEAVRLFVERVRLRSPRFAIVPENVEAVVQVCRQLDGLPLAIELAAARTDVLTPQQLARELRDRYRLLVRGSSPAVPHHQTLRAAMDWSFALLSAPERLLFRRLAVFGGWSREAVEAVCTDSQVPATGVLELLSSLSDKSLIAGAPQGQVMRWRMLDTMRAYAWERLVEGGEAEALRERHAAWCCELAETAAPHLYGGEAAAWLQRLEAEHDNLRAALTWSLDAGRVECAVRLASALAAFWSLHAHLREGRSWLLRVLALAAAPGTAPGIGQLFTGLAVLERQMGAFGDALRHHEEAIARLRECADQALLAQALFERAVTIFYKGDLQGAEPLYQEALALHRQRGDTRGEAMALFRLANLQHLAGRYSEARQLHRRALETWRGLGHQRAMADSLFNLGYIALDAQDYPEAARCLRDSLELLRLLADSRGTAWVLEGFAGLAAATGQPERAARLAGASSVLRLRCGAPIPPAGAAHFEQMLAPARSSLVTADWERAWQEGAGWSLEQALANIEAGGWPDQGAPPAQLPTEIAALTPREREVLRLVAEGLSNREIGQQLVLSVRTVERHIENIYGKLGVHSRVQAAAMARHAKFG